MYGRRDVYLVTFGLYNGLSSPCFLTYITYITSVCHLATALCRSSTGMIITRFFLGVGGSTFGALIGGIISDIYLAPDRGFPMALFAMFGLGFIGVGPLVSGVIAEHLSWRWIHWLQLIFNGVLMAVSFLVLKETRGSALLSRKAKALNKFLDESGDRGNRWKVKADEERESIAVMVRVSLTRPFRFLVTEPVVFWFSCWLTFAWGILYMWANDYPSALKGDKCLTQLCVGS